MQTNSQVLEGRNQARDWFNAHIHGRKLTGEDVAALLGVNTRTLRGWIGIGRIPREQVPKLCEAIVVTQEDLAKHFRFSEEQLPSGRRASALDKIGDIMPLVRIVQESGCDRVTIADLEFVASLPLDFGKGLSADEITTAQTLFRARRKK